MGACTPSLSRNCMPPRTTRKSHRPRVSDRTMVGTAQPLCLSRPKPKGIVTTSRWTWEQQNSKRLIATRGWMTRSLPVGGGSVFLDIPFYRTGFRETVNRRRSLSENPTHEVLSRMGGSPTIQSISQGETRNPRAIAFKKHGGLAWKALLRLDGM